MLFFNVGTFIKSVYNVFMFIQIVPEKSHEKAMQAVLSGDRSYRKHKN